jgi:hypothetical protein
MPCLSLQRFFDIAERMPILNIFKHMADGDMECLSTTLYVIPYIQSATPALFSLHGGHTQIGKRIKIYTPRTSIAFPAIKPARMIFDDVRAPRRQWIEVGGEATPSVLDVVVTGTAAVIPVSIARRRHRRPSSSRISAVAEAPYVFLRLTSRMSVGAAAVGPSAVR